jgi:hypothetical protein
VATAGYCHSQAPQGCRLASTTIAAMCSGQSLCLVATTHHRLSLLFVAFVGSASGHGMAALPKHHKAVAWCACHVVVIARCGNTLRFYITPHCIKCMPSQSPSSFGGHAPLVAPYRVYAAGVMQSCLRWVRSPVVGAPRSLRALRAATCRPVGVPAWWLCSGALRSAFSQRLRRVICVGPRPPLALACFASIACAVCPSAPQGGSLRTAQETPSHHRSR